MAKSRNRKKKRTPIRRLLGISPESQIKKTARKIPIDTCLVNVDWEESTLAVVVIIRKRLNNTYLIASFVVDTGCLGVKNTLYQAKLADYELEDFLEHYSEGMELEMIEIDKDLACSIVYGAVEYAKNLGFSPNKDYAVTKYVLEPETAIERIPIEFGKNGKPFYFSGPYDNVDQILAKLNKAVGKGNYEFIAEVGENDDFYSDKVDFTDEDFDNRVDQFENEVDKFIFSIQIMFINIIGKRINMDISQLDTLLEDDTPEDIIDEMIDLIQENDVDYNLDYSKHILYATFLLTIKKLKESLGPGFMLKENYFPSDELDSVIEDLPIDYKILFVLDNFVLDVMDNNSSKFDNPENIDDDLIEDLVLQTLKKMEADTGEMPPLEIRDYLEEQIEDKVIKIISGRIKM